MSTFNDLVADAKKYLQDEFSSRDMIEVSPDDATFFAPFETKPKPVFVAPPSQPKKPITPPAPPPPAPAPVTPKKEAVPFDDFAAALRKISPSVNFVSEPPSDVQAKRISEGWKHPMHEMGAIVFSLGEPQTEKAFLQNLAKAIDTRLTPARCIEATNKNLDQLLAEKNLKCILVPPTFVKFPPLLAHLRELPATGEKFFGGVPLVVLSPIASYFQQPQLKSALWKRLCLMIQN